MSDSKLPAVNTRLLSASPHSYIPVDPQKIMIAVIVALLPAAICGVVIFGLGALVTILVSIASAVLSELAFELATKQKPRVKDCSAAVTGLLLALILPPSTPWWMTALGAMFAIIVAKEFFGGLGQNPFNPALTGRAFLLMSFPAAITTWHKPFQALVDTATTATPLNIVRQTGDIMKAAESVGAATVNDFYMTLLMGNRAGSIGETSIILVLLGGLFLALVRVIDLRTPLALLLATSLSGWALGIDPVFGLLSGGVVFGAFFMATDYSTGPITPTGKIVFGLCTGVIISVIRKFGAFPEGVTYGILIMNAFVPFLDKIVVRKYGFVKPLKPAVSSEKKGA